MTNTKSKTILRQVLLRRKTDSGTQEDVFWIANELAKINNRVQDEDGIIWTVAEIYNAKSYDNIEEIYKAWKRWADVLDGH
jgi:hypothetical protein